MSAGKQCLKAEGLARTALLALVLIVAIAGNPGTARAGCSMPRGPLLGGSAALDLGVERSSQPANVHTLPLGKNEPIVGLWQITTTFPNVVVVDIINDSVNALGFAEVRAW